MEKQDTKAIMNVNWGLPLPQHMTQVIFSKRPISHLSACRIVCKSWNHLILDYASFSKFPPNAFLLSLSDCDPTCIRDDIPIDFYNGKIYCLDIDTLSIVASFEFDVGDLESISFVTSCNGLLHVCTEAFDGIFNPTTGELFKLSGLTLEDDNYIFGFGFSPKKKQYKLFKVFYGRPNSIGIGVMEILTFGSCQPWRHVVLPFPITLYDHGAYLDGFVYWIEREKENEYVIYALDVETEKMKLMAVLEVGPYSRKVVLQSFNGIIYAIIYIYAPFPKIQVWRLRDKDSWIRDFVVLGITEGQSIIYFVKASQDGDISFLVTNQLFCLDKSGRVIYKKPLVGNDRRIMCASQLESLHFVSLPNILAGHD